MDSFNPLKDEEFHRVYLSTCLAQFKKFANAKLDKKHFPVWLYDVLILCFGFSDDLPRMFYVDFMQLNFKDTNSKIKFIEIILHNGKFSKTKFESDIITFLIEEEIQEKLFRLHAREIKMSSRRK